MQAIWSMSVVNLDWSNASASHPRMVMQPSATRVPNRAAVSLIPTPHVVEVVVIVADEGLDDIGLFHHGDSNQP
jgi:hypothetical protein